MNRCQHCGKEANCYCELSKALWAADYEIRIRQLEKEKFEARNRIASLIGEWELTYRVLQVTSKIDNFDCLFWRTDENYAPVTFFVMCNDLFYWGAADLERITKENIGLLEQTADEMLRMEADSKTTLAASWYVPELFCCRSRGMRPQPPCYKSYPEYMHPLFDACGPEVKPGERG